MGGKMEDERYQVGVVRSRNRGTILQEVKGKRLKDKANGEWKDLR